MREAGQGFPLWPSRVRAILAHWLVLLVLLIGITGVAATGLLVLMKFWVEGQ